MLKAQATTKALIDRFMVNLNKTGAQNQTEGFLKARKVLLEKYWTTYVTTHMQITTDGEIDPDEEYFKYDEFSETECTYAEHMGLLEDKLKALRQVTGVNNLPGQALVHVNENQNTNLTTLPRIPIPRFTGNYAEWPSFKDLFRSLIHKNQQLSNVQRLHYLKSNLGDEAAMLLRNVTITDANYNSAWEMLSTRYENLRIIVHSQLQGLMTLPALHKESCSGLRILLNGTVDAKKALSNIGRPTEHWDDWFIYVTTTKLDPLTRKDWESSIACNAELPTFDQLERFLLNRLHTLEAVEKSKYESTPSTSRKPDTASKTISHTKSHVSTSSTQCKVSECNGKHSLLFCPKFRNENVINRRTMVKNLRVCFNCLKYGHLASECSMQDRCHKCGELHHTMLHKDAFVSNEPRQSTSTGTSLHLKEQSSSQHSVLLATAVVDLVCKSGSTIRARALLDQGSEITFVSEHIAQMLCLPRQRTHVAITGIGGETATTAKSMVEINVLSHINNSQGFKVKAFVLLQLTNFLPSNTISVKQLPHIRNLQLADPKYLSSSKIDLIIGADAYGALILPGIRRGNINEPVAQNTILGWIVSGPVQHSTNLVTTGTHSLHTSHCEIQQQLQQFWELEEVSIQRTLTKDEKYCMDYFNQTTTRNSDGRFIVRLPIKDPSMPLLFGDTYALAFKRLIQIEHRFQSNIALQNEYKKFLFEYELLKHMEIISDWNELDKEDVFYLPHHGVLKQSSTSTKLRVVFNASSRVSNHPSLNDRLHIGPKLQRDITTIIMKWRKFPIVFSSDIEKMFRQILVHPKDVNLQRILWRDSTTATVTHYRLNTVTYGTACAPFLAIQTLLKLADDERANFPTASSILEEGTYVDDILSGAYDLPYALLVQHDLRQLLYSGGFVLKKWSSNRREMIDHLPEDFIETKLSLDINFKNEVKTLGILWYPSSDTFGFKVDVPEISSKSTKRSVLSTVARIYDPFGWIAPITLLAKILLQRMWTLGLDWDDSLPDSENDDWLRFRNELPDIQNIVIKRWFGSDSLTSRFELHGFADASTRAYAAVVYLCTLKQDGSRDISLIGAKSKVSPIKKLTIPRLELCGALLLSRLLKKIQNDLNVPNENIYAWSDAKIVLDYIKSDPNRWKIFIANRVTEIQETYNTSHWSYVPTTSNPADYATRGVFPSDMVSLKLWWNGPPWLSCDISHWPKINPTFIDGNLDLEEKSPNTLVHAAQTTSSWDILSKYCSLLHLLRVLAYILRFISKTRHTSTATTKFNIVTPQERKMALYAIIKMVQKQYFSQEINDLLTTGHITRKGNLQSLNPFLDIEGILRVGGRLQNSHLEYDAKHPIILPKHGPFTKLLVDYYHQKCLHGGPQLTINTIRQTYWVFHLRGIVKQHIRSCLVCIRYTANIRYQIMGRLPSKRVTMSHPFQHTGVDYAGPIIIKRHKGRGQPIIKSYIVIFVCFSIKAVHIELATDLTSETFLGAFHRFTSRRGVCSDLYSDHGTNFVGANKELVNNLKRIQADEQLAQSLSNDGTTWHFISPGSPHFGGLWESAVKSCKHHLKRVIGETILTYEELLTLLTKIEACLNSRPLYSISSDPADSIPITPGHFLIGRPITAIPDVSYMNTNENYLTRWQRVQSMTQNFWNKWSKEYLNQLQQRYKWSKTTQNLKINDLVLVKDERFPPTKWPIGRIIAVHPGPDDLVRVATVRYNNSEFKRPITKLIPIPMEE